MRAGIGGTRELLKVKIHSGEVIKVSEIVSPIKIESGQTIIAKISGEHVTVASVLETIKVSGLVTIASGTVTTEISGQTVKVSEVTSPITIASGQEIVAKISGQLVVISGQTVTAKISGETITVDKISNPIEIAPDQTVTVDKITSPIAIASGQISITSGTVSLSPATSIKTGPRRVIPSTSGGVVLHSGSVKSALIKASPTNAGKIYIGGAGSPPADGVGLELHPGEAIVLDVDNFDAVYLYAENSGDTVTFLGLA